MKYFLNGREVVDISVDGVFKWDYPDFSDCFLSHAYWCDTFESLNNAELEALEKAYPDLAYSLAMESFH